MSNQEQQAKSGLSVNTLLFMVLVIAIMLWAVRWDILNRVEAMASQGQLGAAHSAQTSHGSAQAEVRVSLSQEEYEQRAAAGVNWQDDYVQPKNLVREIVELTDSTAVATAAAPAAAAAPVAIVGDAAAGQKVFNKCKSCHTVDKGGKHRTGPNLWGIYGAKAAATDFKNYSDDLSSWGGTWSEENMSQFFEKPKAMFKKTRMSFAGLKNEQDRADVIAYLKTLAD